MFRENEKKKFLYSENDIALVGGFLSMTFVNSNFSCETFEVEGTINKREHVRNLMVIKIRKIITPILNIRYSKVEKDVFCDEDFDQNYEDVPQPEYQIPYIESSELEGDSVNNEESTESTLNSSRLFTNNQPDIISETSISGDTLIVVQDPKDFHGRDNTKNECGFEHELELKILQELRLFSCLAKRHGYRCYNNFKVNLSANQLPYEENFSEHVFVDAAFWEMFSYKLPL